MKECPSLVALLALSRQTQERRLPRALRVCSPALARFQLHHASWSSIRCATRTPRQMQAAAGASRLLGCTGLRPGLRGLSVHWRPAHDSCRIEAEERSIVVPHRASSVLRGRAAPRARPVQAPAMRPRRTSWYAFPPKRNPSSLLAEAWPNPSIERTAKSTLRMLSSAAHVKR